MRAGRRLDRCYRSCQFTVLLASVVLLAARVLPVQAGALPSSRITAVDTRTSLVSAEVVAIGQRFDFRLNNPALLKTLAKKRVGGE